MKLDAATARLLAVEADVDPRSVRREFAEPGSVRGMSGHRIRTVLAARGLGASKTSTETSADNAA